LKNAGYYAFFGLGIVLGLAVTLPCSYGLYKSAVWTWGIVESYSPGGHPMSPILHGAFVLGGLVAVGVTGSGVLSGLGMIVAALVAINVSPSSQSDSTLSAPGAQTGSDASAVDHDGDVAPGSESPPLADPME
jgi:hypothetical protein